MNHLQEYNQHHNMNVDLSEDVLATLRRISRAVELYSKALVREYGLTGPQLTILTTIRKSGSLSVSDLARRISLSQATVTSILDRLEQQDFVVRTRGKDDKRLVYIELTDKSRAILEHKPRPLHNDFLKRFAKLEDWEQSLLLSSIQRIAKLMHAENIEMNTHTE
ncbi:MarR family transcriptional regulator [Treponema sp.]